MRALWENRKIRWAVIAAVALACLAAPVLLLPVLIIAYIALGGHGPSFVTAAYGVSLRPTKSYELPVSNSAEDDEDIRRFLARRQQERSRWMETDPLSRDEEEAWDNIILRWD